MQPPPRALWGIGEELAAVHARLSGILLTEQTMDTALQLITSLARDTVAGSLGSGVTLLRADGQPATSASTDPLVESLDTLQYGLGEGPCLTAWAGSTMVTANDLTTEDRWPIWSPQAVSLGVRSVLSAPMEAGGTPWGAIKVYAESAGAYDERAEDVLRRFAAQAAIFVSNVHLARDLIATATGMVAARKGLDPERAYRQLISLSRSARIPLSELAERMVASPVRPRATDD